MSGITKGGLNLCSYLGGHQKVRAGNDTSTELCVHNGVQQVSLLGPLLFLDFFNELSDSVMLISYGYAINFNLIDSKKNN